MVKNRVMTVPALAKEIARMESDMKTVAKVIAGLLDALGLSGNEFTDAETVESSLPSILGSLTQKALMGKLNAATFSDAIALAPILSEYKYLLEGESIKTLAPGESPQNLKSENNGTIGNTSK